MRGLNRLRERPLPLKESELRSKKILAYGDIHVLVNLWNRLGISGIITKHLKRDSKVSFDVSAYALLMTLHRLIDPASKLALTDWFTQIDFPLLTNLDYQKLLRSLAYLYRIKDKVEVDLFEAQKNLFNLKVDIIFYDVTSTYFEGEGPAFVDRGYSRDKRPDRPQILLALAVTQEGLPIGHETYAGNISDKTTVIPLIEKLKTRFNIGLCIFVGDRGMVSPQNIAYLKQHQYEYILALRRRRLWETKEKFEPDLSKYKTLKTFSLEGIPGELKYLELTSSSKGEGYIVCHNEEIATNERNKVNQRIQKIKNRITEITEEHRSPEIILKKVARIYLVDRFFEYGISGGRFYYDLKEKGVAFEKLIAGKYILKTDNQALSAPEVISAYKNLMLVEDAFKDIKSFIDIRPIYHRYDLHVKGHVFICVLSFLLQRALEKYFARPNEPKVTARRLLAALSEVKVVENEINGHLVGTIVDSTREVHHILKRLDIPSFGKTTLLYPKTVKLPPVTIRKLKRYDICSK
jgi:transposase